jgi:hypothetical protein
MARAAGDHLVGWANSSLRFLDELPALPGGEDAKAKGVVLEDPLETAFFTQQHPQARSPAQQWVAC